ncbi:hypothetical protein, partial [Nitrospirillum viridazoti]
MAREQYEDPRRQSRAPQGGRRDYNDYEDERRYARGRDDDDEGYRSSGGSRRGHSEDVGQGGYFGD